MSGARAMAWAWEQELPPAEKLLLLAIADNAGKGGTWLFGAQREMAVQTGMGERTVRRHLASLEERGLILRRAMYESGLRVPDHIALAVDGDLPANLAGSNETAGNGHDLPANLASGQSGRALQSSTTARTKKPSQEKNGEPGQFDRALAELPAEMRGDVLDLLSQRRSVARQRVTEAEMLIAAAALAEFNRQAETDYGLGANLTGIVMRIRERPSWDAAKHVRLVQSAWRIRWWERTGKDRRPTPQVIYGERAFENVVQDAAAEAAGKPVQAPRAQGQRVFTPDGRSWDQLTSAEQMAAREAMSMGIDPAQEREAVGAVPVAKAKLTAENFLDG